MTQPSTSQYVPRDFWIWRVVRRVNEPFGCFLLLLWMIVALPLSPLILLFQRRRRSRFVKRLGEQGRIISWHDFLAATRQRAGGTVIMEVGNKCATRFWWVTGPVREHAPMPAPAIKDQDIIGVGGSGYHPFARWCYERYLSARGGTALLVHPGEAEFETFPFDDDLEEQMRRRFEGNDVIVLAFYDTRYV